MKTYNVSLARARLSDLLDAAERGERVFIERRGVLHAITVQEPPARPSTKRPRVEIVDDAIESGNWSWTWQESGLRFKPRPRRRR